MRAASQVPSALQARVSNGRQGGDELVQACESTQQPGEESEPEMHSL